MRRLTDSRYPMLIPVAGLAVALIFAMAAVSMMGANTVWAEEEKQPTEEPSAPPAAGAEAEDPAVVNVAPPPEPERIEGKLIKIDPEGKLITVLVEPDKGGSSRAYRRFKLQIDDKTLILIEQQPKTLAELESGVRVQVAYWDKGKTSVADTVVVIKED